MKTHPTKLALAALALFSSLSHAADFAWQGGNFNWNDANWRNNTTLINNVAPGTGTDNHNFAGFTNPTVSGTIIVDSAVSTFALSGDRGNRTLNIVSGGSLAVGDTFQILNRANEASTITVNIGGSLAMSNVNRNFNLSSANAGDVTRINVNSGSFGIGAGTGNSVTGVSGATTEINVQGGELTSLNSLAFNAFSTFNVRNVSGSSVDLAANLQLNGGVMNITGDAAGTIQIGDAGFEGLSITNSASQLNYVFDSTGVSALNMGRLSFNSAITLNLSVNADALAGATVGQQILLLDYTEWRLNNVDQGTASITSQFLFSDLGTNITGVLVNNTTTEQLFYQVSSVSAVPEPSTFAALAGLGVLGFAATRRRRA